MEIRLSSVVSVRLYSSRYAPPRRARPGRTVGRSAARYARLTRPTTRTSHHVYCRVSRVQALPSCDLPALVVSILRIRNQDSGPEGRGRLCAARHAYALLAWLLASLTIARWKASRTPLEGAAKTTRRALPPRVSCCAHSSTHRRAVAPACLPQWLQPTAAGPSQRASAHG